MEGFISIVEDTSSPFLSNLSPLDLLSWSGKQLQIEGLHNRESFAASASEELGFGHISSNATHGTVKTLPRRPEPYQDAFAHYDPRSNV